jgi:hypothetical protein
VGIRIALEQCTNCEIYAKTGEPINLMKATGRMDRELGILQSISDYFFLSKCEGGLLDLRPLNKTFSKA